MAHRGRLNVLAHIVGLPYETIFAEFEGGRHVEETLTPEGGTGDVKYHHGADGVYQTAAGKPVNITLSPNPSHLEAVKPVVEGRERANQTNRRGKDAIHDWSVALPVLIHGDASLAAQGAVAETFNLARRKGHTPRGTRPAILSQPCTSGSSRPPPCGSATPSSWPGRVWWPRPPPPPKPSRPTSASPTASSRSRRTCARREPVRSRSAFRARNARRPSPRRRCRPRCSRR